MHSRTAIAAVIVVLASGFFTACGDDDDSDAASTEAPATTEAPAETTAEQTTTPPDASTTQPTTDDGAGTDIAAEADLYYAGTYTDPPAESPPPATDKNVWVISCGEAAVGCAQLAGGAVEAGEVLGWDMTLYDGKLGADGAYPTGVRQAVAAGADALLIGAIDCALIAQPLAEAREAGVVVVGLGGYDCDDARVGGGEPLFDASPFGSDDLATVEAQMLNNGDARAAWLLNTAGTSGLKVLSLRHADSLLGSDLAAGFEARIQQECEDCEIVPLDFTFADLGTGAIGTKVSDALVQNPDVNALFAPYDSVLLLGVAQAVMRSGRADSINVVGGEGYTPNLELIRTNAGQDMAIGSATRWTGWAGVDTLNRLFAGEAPVAEGFGLQFIDAEHMPEDDGVAFIPPVDYKAKYKAAWGVS